MTVRLVPKLNFGRKCRELACDYLHMQVFRNLKVWQKAHELALLCYRLTSDFPRDEVFGLRNSIRKTCIDIPAYIAEGCGKANDVDFSRAMTAALGFANRLEYYVLMARDLEFLNPPNHDRLNIELIEVKKMINGFNRRLA